jgi:two-component system, sensor histidine kinase and response regulator
VLEDKDRVPVFDDDPEYLAQIEKKSILYHSPSEYSIDIRKELHTPLNVIINYSHLLFDEMKNSGHKRFIADIQKINEAGEGLLKAVAKILDESRQSSDKKKINIELLGKETRYDLRTPLNTISGYTDMLLEEPLLRSNINYSNRLSKIKSSCESLLAVMDTIINLSKISESKKEIEANLDKSPIPIFSLAKASNLDGSRTSSLLVVDDNKMNRDMLSRRLLKQGYHITIAENGQEALDQIEQHNFDLILLDIMMPGIDGFQVLEKLKKDERLRYIPVIVISALDDIESIVKCIKMGAEDYLQKPFNPVLLNARISASLEKKFLRDQERAYIDELSEMHEVLHNHTIELKARNEELNSFAHTVAHDLKNPLSPIIGFSQLLRDYYKSLSEEDLKAHLTTISNNSMKMNNIINELLLLASVREQEIQKETLDMGEIIKETMDRLSFMINDYKAEFTYPTEWIPCLGYGPWVEEVWANYLSNALKYGGLPPKIEFGCEMMDIYTVKYWIKDNGAGLTPEEQKKLFAPFTQLSQVRAKGHGLGLSIVHRIMEKLNGKVGVFCPTEGGSIFYFTLPTV